MKINQLNDVTYDAAEYRSEHRFTATVCSSICTEFVYLCTGMDIYIYNPNTADIICLFDGVTFDPHLRHPSRFAFSP